MPCLCRRNWLPRAGFTPSTYRFPTSPERAVLDDRAGPVSVITRGRITGYFAEAYEFDNLQRLRELERRLQQLSDLGMEFFGLLNRGLKLLQPRR